MSQFDFYYSEIPWSIVKSFILTFDKTRITKTAKIMKPLCESFQELLTDDSISITDSDFSFVYFYTAMKYHKNFNYSMFPRY